MRELLEARYGNGYHIKALEDLYLDRQYSQAISISTNISEPVYEEHHQKAAWSAISNSLADMFKDTTKDVASSVSWRMVVESNIPIPSFLDQLVDRLKLALIATGAALQQIIEYIYTNIGTVWQYIRTWFTSDVTEPKTLVDAEAESNTFFSSLSRYIDAGIAFFESLAHKVASGLLTVIQFLRSFLYTVGNKMTEFLYGSIEALYKAPNLTVELKRGLTKIGFWMVSFSTNLAEHVKGSTVAIQRQLVLLGRKIQEFVQDVAFWLIGRFETLTNSASWLLEKIDVSLEWISKHLPWLSTLVGALKSFGLTLFSTVNTMAPLITVMFGDFFQGILDRFLDQTSKTPATDLVHIQTLVERFLDDNAVPDEYKPGLKQSKKILLLAQKNLKEKREVADNQQFDESLNLDTQHENVSELLTQIFEAIDSNDDDDDDTIVKGFDVDLFDNIVQKKTGFDSMELYYLQQSASDIASAHVIRAFQASFSQEAPIAIKGGLTPDEQQQLILLTEKGTLDTRSTRELLELTYLLEKQSSNPNEGNLVRNVDGSLVRTDALSVDDLESLAELRENEIVKELKALIAFERQHNIIRNSTVQTVIKDIVQMKADAATRGETISTVDVARARIPLEVYNVFIESDMHRVYLDRWSKLNFIRMDYSIILTALDRKVLPLSTKKAVWSVATAIAAVVIPGLLYYLVLTWGTDSSTGNLILEKNVTEIVSRNATWWDSTWSFVSRTPSQLDRVSNTIVREITTPTAVDALDVRRIWQYLKAAFTTDSIGGVMAIPKYVALLSLVVIAAPIANAIVLGSWFWMTTVIFLFLEWKTPGYHTDARFISRAFANLPSSSMAVAQLIFERCGLLLVTALGSMAAEYSPYLSIGVGVLGALSSLNFGSVASSVVKGGANILEMKQKSIQVALEKRFNWNDLWVPERIRKRIIPVDLLKYDGPRKKLSLLEMLEITEILRDGEEIIDKEKRVLALTRGEPTDKEKKRLKKEKKRLEQAQRERERDRLPAILPPKGKEEEDEDDDNDDDNKVIMPWDRK